MRVKDRCRQAGISVATTYQWKSNYGGLDASELRRVKELEAMNAKRKRLVAELSLDRVARKDAISQNAKAGADARGGAWVDPCACKATEQVLSLRWAVSGGVGHPAEGVDGAQCGLARGIESAGGKTSKLGILDVLYVAA